MTVNREKFRIDQIEGSYQYLLNKKLVLARYFLVLLRFRYHQEKIILWDTPGFGDNKGLTQNLINTYYIHRLFSIQNQVRLVFTMNFQDLASSQRAIKFQKIISSFVNGLKNFKDYQSSVAILVTKCNQGVTLQDIENLLKENTNQLLKMDPSKENRKFLTLLNSKKLVFLLVRQPDIGWNVKRNNSVLVTNQYYQFRQDFYRAIMKLKPAKVPKLQSPEMTPENLNQCIHFANDVYKSFKEDSEKMASLLQKYYEKKFNGKKNFTDDYEQAKRVFEYVENILEDVKNWFAELYKIVNDSKQFTQSIIKDLNKIFKEGRMQFQIKQNICQHLQKIGNLLIISNFLQSINIPTSRNPSSQKKLLGTLKNTMINSLQKIVKMKDAYFKQIQKSYAQFVRRKFSQNLEKWKNQQAYKKWLQDIKAVPYLFLKMSKFSDKSNLSTFINTAQGLQKQSQMQCSQELTPLLEIHENQKKKNLIMPLNEKNLVQNLIKTEVIPKQNQLKEVLLFEKWDERTLEEIYFNLTQSKSIEMINTLKEDINKRDKIISSQDAEMNKLKQADSRKDKIISSQKSEMNKLKQADSRKDKIISTQNAEMNKLKQADSRKDKIISTQNAEMNKLKQADSRKDKIISTQNAEINQLKQVNQKRGCCNLI